MATDDTDTDAASADALKPGTALSDTYEIVRHLATGGMAEVYRARNIHTDEPVAIKVVLPAFAKDETITALFKKEATVLSRLHHDAIVHYHLFTIEKDMKRPYLVMEFVDGTALSDHIRRAPLDVRQTRTLITRIASGLAAAHNLGVIHRDLSPDNVILPEDDVSKTKIIDFGIAKAATVGKGTLLGDKFAGKYNYVSPEQLGLFGGEITPRSDMYSLGLIAAAALTGRAIDMTGSGSHVDVIDKRREVPDLSMIDPVIRPVIAAMLQPKPADRPRDMQEVIDLLSGALPLTIPPQTQAPRETSIPPAGTGTVFGANMPAYQPPPAAPQKPATDLWKDPTQIHARPPSQPPVDYFQSQPPGYGQMPQQGYQPQQSIPPGYGNMPPQSYQQPQSVPPGYGSVPPTGLTQVPTTTAQTPGQPFSESPFGPYVEKPGEPKFKMPPMPDAPAKGKRSKKKSGSPMGLILGLGAVVVIGGVGAVGFTQGWFGGGTTTPTPDVTPTTTVAVTPSVVTPATIATPSAATPATTVATVTPTTATPATTVAVTPSVKPTPTVTPTTVAPTTTTVTVTPTTATPTTTTATVTPTAATTTPSVTPTVTPTAGAGQQILTASAIAEWVDEYPLSDCEFAEATDVALNATTIEAFGTSTAPFQALARDFEETHDFAPDIQLRQINDTQCAMADFLRDVRPYTAPGGPLLELKSEIAGGKQKVSGEISGVAGLNTYILLVDYIGSVIDLSSRKKREGAVETFDFTATLQDQVVRPMAIVTIASREPLENATFKTGQWSKVIFPVIRRDIEASDQKVQVGVQFFKLGAGNAATGQ